MAKKNKTMNYVIILAAIGIIGYILYKSGADKKAREGGGGEDGGILPSGCYPLEEVHEISTIAGEMWVCIIPEDVSGNTTIRPPASITNIGDSFNITNTGSALDGTYNINSIWYDAEGKVGCLRVDIPGGYNFNYNATQGGSVRDMTYFGIGHICFS